MDFLNLRKTDVFELYKENMLFLIVAWKRTYCNLILFTVTNGNFSFQIVLQSQCKYYIVEVVRGVHINL